MTPLKPECIDFHQDSLQQVENDCASCRFLKMCEPSKDNKMKKYTDISVDIETLSACPRSLITSIGLVSFDKDTGEVGPSIEIHVSILSQLFLAFPARRVSLSTLKWWMRQSKQAKKALVLGQKESVPYWKAGYLVDAFVELNTTPSKVRVWGNGAAFDNAILSDFYKTTLKRDIPWKFWNDRCLRTLLGLHEERTGKRIKKTMPFSGFRHSAMYDAVHQAKLVIEASEHVPDKPTNKQVGKFIEEFDELCRKHDISISHEDYHGAFLLKKYDVDHTNSIVESIEVYGDQGED